MKKKLYAAAFFVIFILFLLYFYSFGTTTASNLSLTVDLKNDNGWEISGLDQGEKTALAPLAAIDSKKTVLLTRVVPESWTAFNRVSVDTGRAISVFIDDRLVFENHQADLSQPGELPLMQIPQGQAFFSVFTVQPDWVGKTITVATRLYENQPYASIGFELISDTVAMYQHEAWVNQNALPGAIFGVLTLLLLILFLYQRVTMGKGYAILLLASASLLQMFSYMSLLNENPIPMIDPTLARSLFYLFPLIYIGTKMTTFRKRYLALTLSIWSVYIAIFIGTYVLYLPLPYWFDKVDLLCGVLLGVMLYYCLKERRTNDFIRYFLFLLSMIFLGCVLLFIVSSVLNEALHEFIIILVKEASRLYFGPLLFWVFTSLLITLFLLVVWDLLQDRLRADRENERIQREQSVLSLQMQSAKYQLQALRTSQEQTAIYHHDMRHHLSLLFRFAVEGDMGKIKEYLTDAKASIETVTPVRYGENETINLLLSAFDTNAKAAGVVLSVDVDVPSVLEIDDTALCSLLSNALENTISAAAALPDETQRKAEIHILYKNDQLLISTENAYASTLEMDGESFKSRKSETGHGFGIKSMISTVEQYGGIYSLDTTNNVFTLRLMLPLK